MFAVTGRNCQPTATKEEKKEVIRLSAALTGILPSRPSCGEPHRLLSALDPKYNGKTKEHPGPEPVDRHSPGSCPVGIAHSQKAKKDKEEPAETTHVAANRRSKHRCKGYRCTSSEEHSPLRKLSTDSAGRLPVARVKAEKEKNDLTCLRSWVEG